MEKDTRVVEKLQVYELEKIIANAPKHYFKAAVQEACIQINKNCKKEWSSDLHEFGEKVTGLDTKTPKAKDHIRGVYKFAEGQQAKSKFLGKQVAIEFVKWIGIFIVIMLGLKNSG